jgi:hypothetical protein
MYLANHINKALRTSLLLSCVIAGADLHGQTNIVLIDSQATVGSTIVVPGPKFKRSGYHNFFWGKHYREEWTTPVKVPKFYLDTAAGGLTPYAKGGGRQSKTLRLRNKKNKEYVLRSIDKDFGRALPEIAQGTFLSRIAKDQGSIGHPFSSITITPMARRIGVFHTIPVIVFVPKQPALGEYSDEYGDQLYQFEERPDEDHSDAPNFGYSSNIIGSERLLEHIYSDNDNVVDQPTYMRARLFDMIIGDWGRHADNWRWAKFEEGKLNIYKAVPRDRDQAYSIMDGLYPSLAGKIYKPWQGFHRDIKNINEWNKTAHRFDRMFLNGLEKKEWMDEATRIQQLLDDSIIRYSIRQLPPELYPISGEEIISKLQARRDKLNKYAEAYYHFLAKRVDIIGSQDREYFRIERMPQNETKISIYKITKEGETRKEPVYSRTFNGRETKEIRIYGLEDKDVIEVKGEPAGGVKIRIIDPGAEDSVVFQQKRLHNEISVYSGKKFEYDSLHAEKFDFTIRPVISSSLYKVFDNDPVKLFPRTGIKVLAALTYNSMPWRAERYEQVHHLCANYGIFRKAFNVGYIGRLSRLAGKWDLLVKARLDAPAVENYYGTGNNTTIDNTTIRNYYRNYSTRFYTSLGVERDFAKFQHAEFAVIYQSVKMQRTADHFITDNHMLVDPVIFNLNRYAGAEAGYSFIKANDRLLPTSGFGFTLGGMVLRNLENKDEQFLKVLASTFVYIPLSKQFSFAVRAGGGTMTGDANYYYLNTIGGAGTGEIRGYDRERFYGRHSFHLNNDLRWIFPTHNFFFNGRAGLLGFYDIGRVWQPGEVSKLWHDSYGFGVILSPFNKFAVTATYGVSKEASYMHFKAGLFF